MIFSTESLTTKQVTSSHSLSSYFPRKPESGFDSQLFQNSKKYFQTTKGVRCKIQTVSQTAYNELSS